MSDERKRALLLVAHGSRRVASNDEIRELAQRLAASSRSNEFDFVEAAFLELAEPSIPDGIEDSIQRGATEVVVFPYFLSAGRHVAEDIPAEVRIKQDQHPDTLIRIAGYLGTAEEMTQMIFNHLGRQDGSS